MRLVLDTNAVIAALLWNGPSRRLLEAAIDGRVEIVTSQALLDELQEAMAYPKFVKRIARLGTTMAQLVDRYAAVATVAPAASISPIVIADPDDDAVLACALAADSELVVSGDHALLNLRPPRHPDRFAARGSRSNFRVSCASLEGRGHPRSGIPYQVGLQGRMPAGISLRPWTGCPTRAWCGLNCWVQSPSDCPMPPAGLASGVSATTWS